MNRLQSTINALRETWSSPLKTSSFVSTGKLTPDEFVQAGDYLVYKFRTWSWSPGDASRQNSHLPKDKQFLVTRHVPRVRRLDEYYATGGWEGDGDGEPEVGTTEPVMSVDERGNVEKVATQDDSDSIPDMDSDEDDDDAVIRDSSSAAKGGKLTEPDRTYTLYITYSNHYHTPCLYLSGYSGAGTPLKPEEMLEDIAEDYREKTVTIEEFPLLEGGIRMARVHPCEFTPLPHHLHLRQLLITPGQHAAVMHLLLTRADAALKLRKQKQVAAAAAKTSGSDSGADQKDEWELIADDANLEGDDEEPAIRVDQYLVVFLKFVASVTPGIEHDFTMGV